MIEVVSMSQLGSRAVDFSGYKSGRLTAIAPTKGHSGDNIMWACRCGCGNLSLVSTCNLRSKNTKSCGCSAGEAQIVDLAGRRVGRLAVLARTGTQRHGHFLWHCICDCGEEVYVRSDVLVSGGSRSCGCLARDHAAALGRHQRGPLNPRWNPGAPENERARRTKEYAAWRQAIFERDYYTCRACALGGIAGARLVAHHIYDFSTYPELRTKIANGITLCDGCHADFHREYGKDHTNMLQLQQYIARRRAEGAYD